MSVGESPAATVCGHQIKQGGRIDVVPVPRQIPGLVVSPQCTGGKGPHGVTKGPPRRFSFSGGYFPPVQGKRPGVGVTTAAP